MNQSCIHQLSDQYIELIKFFQVDKDYYPVLLQSVAGSQKLARYDILFVNPLESLILDKDYTLHHYLNNNNNFNEDQEFSPQNSDFLSCFDEFWKRYKLDDNASTMPLSGGWFVFLAYELLHQIEPSVNKPESISSNIAFAQRFPAAIIYDHQKNAVFISAESQSQLQQVLPRIEHDLKQFKELPEQQKIKIQLNEDIESLFQQAANKVKEYIYQGDVFQVNLSRAWKAEISNQSTHQLAIKLYQLLCQHNPAPFACLANIQGEMIISSSPERLCRLKDGILESRPIAGTRPRGKNIEQDQYYKTQLHKNIKEQSEHIMLIDLIRNDLGRVCEAGSVEVNEMMINESYQTVHHIVSNVRGKIRQDVSPKDIIKAMFPGGTITGCPKVRCMQIIRELENTARGAYTGSLGYINHDGSMDLNILIRTIELLIKSKQELELVFRAGAGLVYDSIAENEIKETRAKAKGMLNALSQVVDYE